MIDPSRHAPLCDEPWEPHAAEAAIGEIAADALEAFDADRFWPAHPRDDGLKDGNSSIYLGAAGVIWALDRLRRVGAIERDFDFPPQLPQLLAKTQAEMTTYGDYAVNGSLLFGDMGTASANRGVRRWTCSEARNNAV